MTSIDPCGHEYEWLDARKGVVIADWKLLYSALLAAEVSLEAANAMAHQPERMSTLTSDQRQAALRWLADNGGGWIEVEAILANRGASPKSAAGAPKQDQGKPRWDLLPSSLEEVVKNFTVGAAKYSPHAWRIGKGLAYSRVYAALFRHLTAWWWHHETVDQETKCHPLAAVAWCTLVLLEYELSGTGQDDRQPTAESAQSPSHEQ